MTFQRLLPYLGGALLIVPALSPAWSSLATFALAQGLAALGIAILLRAGQISFGHAFYFALGAYSVAFGGRHVAEATVLILLGTATAAFAGAVLALFISRYRGIFFAMLNLSVSMLAYTVLQKSYEITGGSDGLRVPPLRYFGQTLQPVDQSVAIYLMSAGAVAGALWLFARYLASPMGEALKAIKTNETRLDYLGLPANMLLGFGYVLSAALAGMGGALSALNTGIVTPELAYWTRSAEFVFIAVLGGIGHVAGPILGAIAFEGVKTFALSVIPNSWEFILGAVLFLIVLFAPAGIAGLGRRLSGERT